MDDLLEEYKSSPDTSIAYFYFDFNDDSKRSEEALMRTLILQLSNQSPLAMKSLKKLHSDTMGYYNFWERYSEQRPTAESLLKTLHSICTQYGRLFLVIDGLDECKDRDKVHDRVSQVMNWKLPNMSLLITSRKERDIEASLQGLGSSINIRGTGVDTDICHYIEKKLDEDPLLRRWSANLLSEIRNTLVDGAQGM